MVGKQDESYFVGVRGDSRTSPFYASTNVALAGSLRDMFWHWRSRRTHASRVSAEPLLRRVPRNVRADRANDYEERQRTILSQPRLCRVGGVGKVYWGHVFLTEIPGRSVSGCCSGTTKISRQLISVLPTPLSVALTLLPRAARDRLDRTDPGGHRSMRDCLAIVLRRRATNTHHARARRVGQRPVRQLPE